MNYQYIPVTRNYTTEALERDMQMRKERSRVIARNRRAEVARQKRMLFWAALTLVLGIILISSVFSMKAQAFGTDEHISPEYRYYEEVYVHYGDTLWNIAEDYTDGSVSEIQACINEIRSLNDLGKFETLQSGTYIIVPYYSEIYVD